MIGSNPIFSTDNPKSLKSSILTAFQFDNSAISLPVEKSDGKNFRKANRVKTDSVFEKKSTQSVKSEKYSYKNGSKIDGDPQHEAQKMRHSRSTFGFMDIPELPYTIPRLIKGRVITKIPAGTTLEKEIAKQRWYIEFFFHNALKERMERIRVTRNLNRIKDPREKLRNFNHLCEAYHIALQGGWNPLDENANARLKKEIIGINLDESLVLFESYHKAKGTRPKSMSTYLSTLNAFVKFYGGERKVSTISDYEITDFLNTKEREEKWAGVTYNNCRIALNNLFRYLKVNKYVPENPVTDAETRKKMRTESHQVFSERDFKIIMEWLDKHDKYCQLFVKMIYYTCIRPKELRFLKLKYIDLEENLITIPGTVSKNRKPIPVNIDVSLKVELEKLNLSNFPEESFLLGSPITFVSDKMCAENFAYNRFQKCLEANNLTEKKYTLYSFKHLSNVRKFKAGWTIAEICSANRHSSISETDTYLKELLKVVFSDKAVPAI